MYYSSLCLQGLAQYLPEGIWPINISYRLAEQGWVTAWRCPLLTPCRAVTECTSQDGPAGLFCHWCGSLVCCGCLQPWGCLHDLALNAWAQLRKGSLVLFPHWLVTISQCPLPQSLAKAFNLASLGWRLYVCFYYGIKKHTPFTLYKFTLWFCSWRAYPQEDKGWLGGEGHCLFYFVLIFIFYLTVLGLGCGT